MFKLIKSVLRTIKLKVRLYLAWCLVNLGFLRRQYREQEIVFVVGCGRSGSTFFGTAIEQRYPKAKYFFEPNHVYFIANKRADFLNLFSRSPGVLSFGEEEPSQYSRKVLRTFFSSSSGLVFDKTPHNVFRLKYLKKCFPKTKVIHLVRDPYYVGLSISKLASSNKYQLFPFSRFNQWWGRNDAKKEALILLCKKEYSLNFATEKPLTDYELGILEWICSVDYAKRSQQEKASQHINIKYEDLTKDFEGTMRSLDMFLMEQINDHEICREPLQIVYPPSKIDILDLRPEIKALLAPRLKDWGYNEK